MNFISDLLKQYVPSGLDDVIKYPSSNSTMTALSSFVNEAKQYFLNSEILQSSFLAILLYDPDLVCENVLTESISELESTIGESEDSEAAIDIGQSFAAFFRQFGTLTHEIGGDLYHIYLTALGGKTLHLTTSISDDRVYGVQVRDSAGIFISSLWSRVPNAGSTLNNLVQFCDGTKASIWDVVYSIQESCALSTELADLCSSIRNNFHDPASVITGLTKLVSSSYQAVKDLASRVFQGWAQGGLYGVIGAILSYFKTGSSAQLDEDGNLIFTDNTALIPMSFANGIVSGVVSSILDIATMVAAAFSRIVALGLAVINGIVKFIASAVSLPVNQCSLVYDLSTGYPIGPYGVFQTSRSISSAQAAWMGFAENQGVIEVMVPGGVILYTLTSGESDTYTLNAEFHPDLVDRRGLMSSFFRAVTVTGAPSGATAIIFPESTDAFLDMVSSYDAPQWDIQNGSDGKISVGDSNTMASIMRCNIALYTLFLMLSNGTFSNQVFYVERYTSTNPKGFFTASSATLNAWPNNLAVLTYSETHGVFINGLINVAIHSAWPTESFLPASFFNWDGLASWANTVNFASNTALFRINYTDPVSGSTLTRACDLRFEAKHTAPDPSYNFGKSLVLGTGPTYAIQTPQYGGSTFWSEFVGVMVATTAIIAATVAVAIYASRKINYKRMLNQAKSEKLWARFVETGAEEDARAYRRAALKNNLFSVLFGGGMVSSTSYWSSTASEPGIIQSGIGKAITNFTDSKDSSYTIADILKIIRGY